MATDYQAILDEIDAAVLAIYAGGGAQSISVDGKSITYQSAEDLLKARGYYASLISRASGNSFTRGIPKCS